MTTASSPLRDLDLDDKSSPHVAEGKNAPSPPLSEKGEEEKPKRYFHEEENVRYSSPLEGAVGSSLSAVEEGRKPFRGFRPLPTYFASSPSSSEGAPVSECSSNPSQVSASNSPDRDNVSEPSLKTDSASSDSGFIPNTPSPKSRSTDSISNSSSLKSNPTDKDTISNTPSPKLAFNSTDRGTIPEKSPKSTMKTITVDDGASGSSAPKSPNYSPSPPPGVTSGATLAFDSDDEHVIGYLFSKFPILKTDYEHRPLFSSLIIWASRFGHWQTVRWLIENGVDYSEPDTKPNGKLRTCLHHAAQYGYKELVDLLLNYYEKNNHDVDAIRDIYGFTPLHLACITPIHSILSRMIAQGVDLNLTTTAGDTALHIAVKTCPEEIVELLVEAGADPNQVTSTGYTPLMVAAELGNAAAIVKLAEYDFDLDYTTTFSGDTALHMAARGAHLKCFRYILRMGARRDIVNFMGKKVTDITRRQMPFLKETEALKILEILRAIAENWPNREDIINREEPQESLPEVGVFTTVGIKLWAAAGRPRRSVYDEEPDQEEEQDWEEVTKYWVHKPM